MALSTAWEWSGRKWPKEVEVTRVTRLSSASRPGVRLAGHGDDLYPGTLQLSWLSQVFKGGPSCRHARSQNLRASAARTLTTRFVRNEIAHVIVRQGCTREAIIKAATPAKSLASSSTWSAAVVRWW